MVNTYTTVQGDMWDSVAKKTLNNEYLMSELIDANPAYREVVIFSAGVKLVIPDVAVQTSQDLPPWKRGDGV